MPRRSNDVYQVDLIAALFGGFMIAWLTSAQEVDYQLETTEIAFATLDVKLIGKSDKRGGKNVWLGALPTELDISDYTCLSEALSSEIDPTIFVGMANLCKEKTIERLGNTETNNVIMVMGELEEKCFELAKDAPTTKYKNINQSHVIGMSILGFNQQAMYAGLLRNNRWLTKPPVTGFNDNWIQTRGNHTNCLIDMVPGQFITVMMIPNRDVVDEPILTLKLGASKPRNFYVLETTSGKAEGYLSKEYTARVGSKYVLDTDTADDLEGVLLIAELCLHSGGSADCFIGRGEYKSNTNIPLTKKN